MADDGKGPKDEAVKAQQLMHQLSGVLNNPVMRSLMGSSSFGAKGEVAKTKPPVRGAPPAPSKANMAMPGMMPARPLPPIKPLPGMKPAAGVAGGLQSAAALVEKIPKEQLAPLLL